MTDRELLGALTVLAVRMGLIERGQRLEVVGDPRDDAPPPLCLAFGVHGQARLCCTHDAGHVGAHSWERALIGKSVCTAVAKVGASGDWQCESPAGHEGVHGRTDAAGVQWTWAPGGTALAHDWSSVELATESPVIRCKAQRVLSPIGTGALNCRLVAGHTDPHKDTCGVTWPNDDDPNRCEAMGWGTNGHRARCCRQRGHLMAHMGQDVPGAPSRRFSWRDDPSDSGEPGTVCEAPSPVQPGPDCVLRFGHGGSHSNDPTIDRV